MRLVSSVLAMPVALHLTPLSLGGWVIVSTSLALRLASLFSKGAQIHQMCKVRPVHNMSHVQSGHLVLELLLEFCF